jgi:hypothetical protein
MSETLVSKERPTTREEINQREPSLLRDHDKQQDTIRTLQVHIFYERRSSTVPKVQELDQR